MEEEKVRLFVGGLAAGVSAGDLKERFTPLGKVLNIEVPGPKSGTGHRGFAHVDFLPATDASLRKLFSAYNGCKWRGGCLRIERAKEHFSHRLDRERTIEAASFTTTAESPSKNESGQNLPKPSGRENGSDGAMNGEDLNLFFPKLRKVKAMPVAGLGKHKRSFQRVESSPLHQLLTCAGTGTSCSGACSTGTAEKGRSSEMEVSRRSTDTEDSKLGNRDRLADVVVNKQDGKENRAASDLEGSGENINVFPPKAPAKKRVKSPSRETRDTSGFDVKDEESLDTSANEDTTKESIARERAQQLELMNRLFPEDASTISESTPLLPSGDEKVRKRKRAKSEDRSDPLSTSSDQARPNITDHMNRAEQHSEREMRIVPDQQIQNENVLNGESGNDGTGSSPEQNVTAMSGSEKLLLHEKSIEGEGDVSIRQSESDIKREDFQHLLKVSAGESSDEESDMVFNFGNDSVSLEVAESREKEMVKGIRDIAHDPLHVETRKSPSKKLAATEQPQVVSEIAAKTKEDDSTVHGKPVSIVPANTSRRSDANKKERAVLVDPVVDGKSLSRSKDEGLVHPSGRVSERDGGQRLMGSGGKLSKAHSGNTEVSKHNEPVDTKAEGNTSPATNLLAAHDETGNSNGSAPTLTRSAWKSLVGETGRVVFTLGNLTKVGEGGPSLVSPIPESPKLSNGPQHQNAAFRSFEKNFKADMQVQNPSEESSQTAAMSLASGNVCLFMRSENAEKDWLASKSELRSDYRAKHKHASRTMKKMWGRRST